MTRVLAALPDRAIATLAKFGDPEAQKEMVRRGLAADPAMEAERQESKRQFRTRDDWDWA